MDYTDLWKDQLPWCKGCTGTPILLGHVLPDDLYTDMEHLLEAENGSGLTRHARGSGRAGRDKRSRGPPQVRPLLVDGDGPILAANWQKLM